MKSKFCPRCKETKRLSQFSVFKTGRVPAYCKPCKREMDAEWRAAHREQANASCRRSRHKERGIDPSRIDAEGRIIEGPYVPNPVVDGKKLCRTCGKVKPVACFYPHSKTGMPTVPCIECKKARYQAIARENGVKKQARSPFVFVRNRLKFWAKRGGERWGLTNAEADALLGLPCHFCGALPNPGKDSGSRAAGKPEVAHGVIDCLNIKLGYVPGNAVASCQRCKIKHRRWGK